MGRSLAILGFGRIAEAGHLPGFRRRGWSVAAIAETSRDRREAAVAQIPGVRLHASLQELLSKEKHLDFIAIATPAALHAAQTLECLNAGVAVLCEKPLALSPTDARRIRRACARRMRPAWCVHNWSQAPALARLMQIAASGEIGEVRHVELHALRRAPSAEALPGSWRLDPALAGGGILVDHGWHNLVVISRLLGGRPRRVSARLSGQPVDREATVFLEFSAATALIHLSWLAAERANRGVIYGARGAVELLDDRLRVTGLGSAERIEAFPEKLSAASSHPEWFEAVLAPFEAALGTPALAADNLAEAEFCAEIIHRALRAAPAPAPRLARGALLLPGSRP